MNVFISGWQNARKSKQNIKTGDKYFENVENFKSLGKAKTNQNCFPEKLGVEWTHDIPNAT
jgi:hypothetical protein